jgi:hypothetical protein
MLSVLEQAGRQFPYTIQQEGETTMKYVKCSPTSYVNVRTGPSTSENVKFKMYRGDEIANTWAPGTPFWYGINLPNGKDGYMADQYVVNTRPKLMLDLFGSSTLVGGSTGTYVRNLQTCLISLGHLGGYVDGVFGTNTENAVKKYQKSQGLTQDGKVGAGTKTALYNQCYALFD